MSSSRPQYFFIDGDYEPVMTTITFPAGTISQEVLVQTAENSINFNEQPEVFTVSLSNPIGAVLGPNLMAIVEIIDSDGT